MNKTILIFTLFFALSIFKLNAQNLKNDCEFYKATMYLQDAISHLDAIKTGKIEYSEVSIKLTSDITNSNGAYEKLKEKYSNDNDFKEFELWVQTIAKSKEMIIDEDPTWQFAYYLVKLNISDFLHKVN